MPFQLTSLLAQEAPAPEPGFRGALKLWDVFSTWATTTFGISEPLAVVLFLVVLLTLTFIVERLSIAVVRRLTAKTETKIDDVFVAGLPGVVRAICITLALRVLALVFITDAELQASALTWLHALAVAVVGILFAGLLLRMVTAWVDAKPHMKPLGPGIRLTIKVFLIPLILVTVLMTLGVKIEAFLAGLGIGALAVGLALQDVLRNIFAGIQLVLDQPVRAGDYVQLAGGTKGTVIEMGLRSTKLLTIENNTVIIPNSNLANEVITNTDLIDQAIAQTITIGVVYGSDTRRVERVLSEEATAFAASTPGAVKDSAAVVFFAFADSSLNFRVTVRLTRFQGSVTVMSELHHRLYERLAKEGIDIAFPTRTLHVQTSHAQPAVDAGPVAT